MRRSRTAGAALLVVAMGAGGCQSSSTVVPPHDPNPDVVLATADLAELDIVGHIVENALSRSGTRIRVEALSGTPEQAFDRVVDGGATMTLGFTGDLLHRHDPGADVRAPEDVYRAMSASLPEGLTAADAAPAQDTRAYVVTENTATQMGLHSMSDLRGRCGDLTMGARREVLEDRATSESVGSTYDCAFARRVTLPGDAREVQKALRDGSVGVGVLRSTDPVLHDVDMIALDDEAHAMVAQQLVPVYRKGTLSEDQLKLLNRISGELTTDDVRDLLLGAEFHSAPPEDLALYWLDKHGY